MILVPSGEFLMGSLGGAPEESPPHLRNLPSYYIDRTEITVGQYAQFVRDSGHSAPIGWRDHQPPADSDELPITNITWSDAMRYAVWAGKRLPTEAEWEKAARGTDGRVFPWGDQDQESCRNKDSGKLVPVGQLAAGASPTGCLDMSGNAWEWTADWFQPYPGSTARSAHFGRGYKVIRGGAGEYLYATTNTGTTTQRARLVPYGSHDFVGFRCVQDVPGQAPPYEPAVLLKESEESLPQTLGEPRSLDHQQQFTQLDQTGEIPLQVSGSADNRDLIVSGFPLPAGRVRDVAQVELLDADKRALLAGRNVLAHWPDGSVRWLLLRFVASGNDRLTARILPAPTTAPAQETVERPIVHAASDDELLLDTGAIQLTLARHGLIREVKAQNQTISTGTLLDLEIRTDQGAQRYQAGPADSMTVESQSAVHAEIRWQGPLVNPSHEPGPMRYDLRLIAGKDLSRLRLTLTLVHARTRQEPWEEMKPQCAVSDFRFGLQLARPATALTFATEKSFVHIESPVTAQLKQNDDLHCEITSAGQPLAQGTRAPGWSSASWPEAAITLGVRDFWQNHSKTLYLDGHVLGVRLWSGNEPFVWEGGLAKTHELVIEPGSTVPHHFSLAPLRAVPPAPWMCGSGAAGDLLPRNGQALAQLAYWECWRETAMRNWVNAMPSGMRDYGDAYMGGPYKGRHAYSNLEYDVAMDFLHQFLRTGDVWYLEQAEPMARHQADIDTENVAGFSWKHSPLHTTTQAEFGHVFLRGMLLHHLLSGDARSREVAMKIGDWIADSLLHGRGVGNERQIGWSLYALTALYDVTGKADYLRAAQALSQRLVRQQAPTGRFDIRWDNRIAFFNGIAMNGLLTVNELAPDPELEQGVLRVAARTLGMYPEYACRTLNAYAWALEQTGDARYLDNMHRTWLSSLEFLMDRDATTSETHAWRFPSFAVRYDLFPQIPEPTAELPRADSWRAVRLKEPRIEAYIQNTGSAVAPILLVREGLACGTAALYDAESQLVQRWDFTGSSQLIQTHAIQIPGSSSWCRLTLDSQDAYAWQIHGDHRSKIVIVDRQHRLLPDIMPRAYGSLVAGAREVSLTLAAQGEGFHSATLLDPQGVPVQRVQRFVDFEDPGRYELQLQASVSGPPDGWSLELHNVQVLSIQGMTPYWSDAPASFFHPEKMVATQSGADCSKKE